MKEVHFVHTSDWHLGFYQYNKRERFNDFNQAADKAIDKIIEINPEFVLHTGDIFHKPRPTPETLRNAVRILKKLDRANIPMFIVRGNHDGKVSKFLKRGGGIISLLKDLDLLRYIDDEVTAIPEFNITIMGIGYYPGKQVASRIDQLIQENADFLHSEDFRIVAIHGFVEGQLEETSHISLRKIKEVGVDYFGAGHYHKPWIDKEKQIYAPGSLEATAITDSLREDNIDNVSMYSSFYEVKAVKTGDNWSKPEITTHKITVRPKIHIFYESEQENAAGIQIELEDRIDRAREIISENEFMLSMETPILNIAITTELNFEQISRITIEEWFKDDFIHIISKIDGKSNTPELRPDLGKSVERDDVIIELIQKHDLDPVTHTNTVSELLHVFGSYSTSRKLGEDLKSGIKKLLLQKENTIVMEKSDEKEAVTDTTESEKEDIEPDSEIPEAEEEEPIKRESLDDISQALGLDDFDIKEVS